MSFTQRLRHALRAAGIHLLASIAVAALAAALVFGVWYPAPFDELAGGRSIFMTLIMVDVIIGPLLTLIVFDIVKDKAVMRRDLAVIVALQLGALGYGLHTAFEARPVYLAFEGDRFRLITASNITRDELEKAPPELQKLSSHGPKPLGIHLLKNDEPGYMESLKLSIEGLHPAFRPDRWIDYAQQAKQASDNAKSLDTLRKTHPSAQAMLDQVLSESGLSAENVGYLPLIAGKEDDWVVLINTSDGQPVATLHLDGWQ